MSAVPVSASVARGGIGAESPASSSLGAVTYGCDGTRRGTGRKVDTFKVSNDPRFEENLSMSLTCNSIRVRHEALMFRVEVRDLRRRACRSRNGEAGGSRSREVPGWPVTRYRYRGNTIPNPLTLRVTAIFFTCEVP